MIIFHSEEMIGILDLKSLGYYKINQGILQQIFSKYYRLEPDDTLCEQFNNFINALKKKERKKRRDKRTISLVRSQ